jgi:hypothetical protein
MSRLFSTFGWDGILPVAVGLAPLLTHAMFPKRHFAEVVVVILLPIALALIRIQVGSIQLERVCRGDIRRWRQMLFACAIVLLLMFEMFMMLLTFADDEPQSAWLIPVLLLAAYIVTIWFALRPVRTAAASIDYYESPSEA